MKFVDLQFSSLLFHNYAECCMHIPCQTFQNQPGTKRLSTKHRLNSTCKKQGTAYQSVQSQIIHQNFCTYMWEEGERGL